jgi:hypothetical protein
VLSQAALSAALRFRHRKSTVATLTNGPRSAVVIRAQHVLQRHYSVLAEVHLHLALEAMSSNGACVFGVDERTGIAPSLPTPSLRSAASAATRCAWPQPSRRRAVGLQRASPAT